jgi:hypothetical protein
LALSLEYAALPYVARVLRDRVSWRRNPPQ